jgi:hypothetical protein
VALTATLSLESLDLAVVEIPRFATNVAEWDSVFAVSHVPKRAWKGRRWAGEGTPRMLGPKDQDLVKLGLASWTEPRVDGSGDSDDVSPCHNSPHVFGLVALADLAGVYEGVPERSPEEATQTFDWFLVSHSDGQPLACTASLTGFSPDGGSFPFIKSSRPCDLGLSWLVRVGFSDVSDCTRDRR